MQQAASLEQPVNSGLIKEMDTIIARRPEWRFLEQQRHLKDVIRLLLRDTESHNHHFEDSTLENLLTTSPTAREKALTSSWLSLLISQELQHPPQLTREAFTYTFYLTLAEENKLTQAQLTQVKSTLEKIISPNHSEEGLEKINVIYTFCTEMQRLQSSHFSWDKPWYLTRTCLFFLNHKVYPHWINCIAELMLLLQQHDSLISNRTSSNSNKTSSNSNKTSSNSNKTSGAEFSPQHLHASHPLRKSAIQELEIKSLFFRDLWKTIHENQEALYQFIKKQCNKIPEAKNIEIALQQMTDAWEKTDLLKTDQNSPLEQAHALFAEAEHQRVTLSESLQQTSRALRSSSSSPREKQLCDIIETLFEV